jgi:hypothetical protein
VRSEAFNIGLAMTMSESKYRLNFINIPNLHRVIPIVSNYKLKERKKSIRNIQGKKSRCLMIVFKAKLIKSH